MFKIRGQESSNKTWAFRLGCGCFMVVGWSQLLRRLVTALLLSGLIGFGTVAGAWLEYRPLEAAILLTVVGMVGIAATIAVIWRWLPRFVQWTRSGLAIGKQRT
jgi:hypothetical protein